MALDIDERIAELEAKLSTCSTFEYDLINKELVDLGTMKMILN